MTITFNNGLSGMSGHAPLRLTGPRRGHMSPTRRVQRCGGDDGTRVAGDGGFAIVITGLMLIPLCIFTAFAVDVGIWYAQAARAQRAADAAAMAGVVWLPTTADAVSASDASLARNWPWAGTPPSCNTTTGNVTVTCAAVNAVQWQVAVSAASTVVFARLAGVNSQTIGRSATAEFNRPVPLGSPLSSFGNQLPGAPGCTDPDHNLPSAFACSAVPAVPNFWATINGPYESHANGDPFSTRCWGDRKVLSPPACTDPATSANLQVNPAPPGGHAELNPYYQPDGYLYAVDVKTPGTVQLEIYDAAYDARVLDTTETGDGCGVIGCGAFDGLGPTTEFTLYDWSGSAFQTNPSSGNEMKTKGKCSGAPADLSGAASTGTLVAAPHSSIAPSVYKNKWTTLCTFTVTASTVGIYPLRVRVDDIPGLCPFTNVWTPDGCGGGGQNSFAIKSTCTCTSQVYAIDNMAIYSNWDNFTTVFNLADIQPTTAGKTMMLDLYDVGDGFGVGTITLTQPLDAGGNPVPPYACDWVRSANQGGPSNGASATGVNPCSITVGGATSFNNQWARVTLLLPVGYSCAPAACWWKINYSFAGHPHDHTTWALNIVGEPVHLVQ